ncbi:hypothetical protein NDI76_01140 [Halogeometricum sp. S1BR25-6]|uniref:DUF2231 domain-containing protein n=1 Tax=Halogeometricum salsisoli TaxID=2950536 RepID=A0ABU2G955_9EURY|nr:hypothetical protein [Halogeometricum sp. S1BR25-6]MDS0297347.1 hypothetical protein [Halogeometricum sp. S1BR25-6]
MDPTKRLASNLRSESSAYGYTLTIWGAGALLIHEYGMPGEPSVFAYVGGALLGFAALSWVAFGGPLSHVDETDVDMTALSMIHVAATAGNLVVVVLVANMLHAAGVRPPAAFGVVGAQSTVVYNASLLLEDFVSEALVSAFST